MTHSIYAKARLTTDRNLSNHVNVFPPDGRFRCVLDYRSSEPVLDRTELYATAISLVYWMSKYDMRKYWEHSQFQLTRYDVCIRWRSENRPGEGQSKILLQTRFITNAMVSMGDDMSAVASWKPATSRVYWYNELVGYINIGHRCTRPRLQNNLIDGHSENSTATTSANLSLHSGLSKNITNLTDDGRISIKYRFLDTMLQSVAVFLTTLAAMTTVIEAGLDSRCADFTSGGFMDFSIKAVEDRFGNVKLRYSHILRVLYKIPLEMVAKFWCAEVEFVVFIGEVEIAHGTFAKERPFSDSAYGAAVGGDTAPAFGTANVAAA